MHRACMKRRSDGVAGILTTNISVQVDAMVDRLGRLAVLREVDELVIELILGIHIEGPFIIAATGYRGAHPEDAIRSADLDTL